MTMLIVHSPKLTDKIQTLKAELSGKIDVNSTSSFIQATDYCNKNQPQLILLQDRLEDGNAFDFCTRFRLLQDQKMIPIIIFAETPDKKDRVRTFQVGADDYISEFDAEHLKAVVDYELENNKKLSQLEQEMKQASHLVLEAMKTSSELGNAINFIERCHRFATIESVGEEIVKFCNTINLNVVIGVKEEKRWFFSSTTGNIAELERDLMLSIHAHDRFIDFGTRTQLNWPNIALLIKNMPIRDPEKYGRIKDLLPTLLSSANVRVHALTEEKRIRAQTALMTRLIETLQPSILGVVEAMKQDQKTNREALSDFLQKLIVRIPGLGLEDDQEEFFISNVEALIHNADSMSSRSVIHQETLQNANEALLELLEKQNEIQEFISNPLITQEEDVATEDLFELF